MNQAIDSKQFDAAYHTVLYYGFQETESGIYHAFEATDPRAAGSDADVAERLAELLDTSADDDRFNYNFMSIRLPDSLVEQIKADGIQEQKKSGRDSADTIFTHDEAAAIMELFENLLEAHGIKVPSQEDDERGEDNGASLYGSTYSNLLDEVESKLCNMLFRLRCGAKTVEGEFSGDF